MTEIYRKPSPYKTSAAGQSKPTAFTIRPMRLSDGPFIIDSWCNSFRHSCDMEGQDPDVYKIEMRNFVYTKVPQCKVLVACQRWEPKHILGWAAFEPPRETEGLWILQYVLVKPEYQKQGVATALVAPIRKESPNEMLWAACYTRGLRHFGNSYLVVNKFVNHRLGGRPKPNTLGGIANT